MTYLIPPEIQEQIALSVGWLWQQYGQKVAEKVGQRVVDEAKWRWSIENYYASLYERVGFVRVLGRMEAKPLEDVFTHVNVLDKPSADRRYNVAHLMTEHDPRDFERLGRLKRLPGDEVVAEHDKLFILGKPGAGKTTFLKHTALRAIEREIKKTPVFVTLKELSDSGMEIVPFIVHQFAVHQFPEAETFVARLLQNGDAIVLFDGLDEVNLADNKRADLIRRLNDFVYRYSGCPILLTCRVAATDYTFTQFEYVEMADFDAAQMGRYIDQWFVGDEVKRQNCRKALLEDKENKAVRELAQVPLLLALLCLVYEERGEFPPNRDEIYEEATRALLVKWDSSRNIARDTVYKQLSLKHKQKMLAHIAADTFTKGEYFLPEKKVVGLIETYLKGVPGLEEPDGERVLRAMEAQHGIFVERARGIHSFSHLTLQEYYAARYIVDNEKRGTVARLMQYVGDDRWWEVFLLTAGMLDDATEFGKLYLEAAPRLLADDEQLLALFHWATQKGAQTQTAYKPPALRAFLLFRALDRTRARDLARARALDRDRGRAHDRDRALARALDLDRALDLARALDRDFDRARALARDLALALARALDFAPARALARDLALALQVADKLGLAAFRAELETLALPEAPDDEEAWRTFAAAFTAILDKYEDEWNPYNLVPITEEDAALFSVLSEEQLAQFDNYLKANLLLVRCLQVAYVPDRAAIEDQILLPPAS